MLATDLKRRTEDIDIVDEIPTAIRSEHELLNSLAHRYNLRLTHFQSHYRPTDWDKRLRSFGRFGKLEVFLVDPEDVLLSKLFSAREKDRDDLRFLLPQFDKSHFIDRLRTSGTALLSDPKLRKNAADNWYIIYGESLPA